MKYKGKLFYVFPTGTKDKIYYGHQTQFNAYKHALATAYASHPAAQTAAAQGQAQMAGQSLEPTLEGAGPTPHRSSAVRWIWSNGRERHGRLVKQRAYISKGQRPNGCCPSSI